MKPIELIVANALHDAFAKIEIVPPDWRNSILDKLCSEESSLPIARMILREISEQASDAAVLKALAATGAPASASDIVQRMRAVRDQRASHA